MIIQNKYNTGLLFAQNNSQYVINTICRCGLRIFKIAAGVSLVLLSQQLSFLFPFLHTAGGHYGQEAADCFVFCGNQLINLSAAVSTSLITVHVVRTVGG